MDDFEIEEPKKDSKQKLDEDLRHYRTVLYFMGANVPIGVLCLPPQIEKLLIDDGCVRVYDLINRDLAKIKGIGKTRLSFLTARLDEFLSVGI